MMINCPKTWHNSSSEILRKDFFRNTFIIQTVSQSGWKMSVLRNHGYLAYIKLELVLLFVCLVLHGYRISLLSLECVSISQTIDFMSIKLFTKALFLCLDLLFLTQSPWWELVVVVDLHFSLELVGDLCCTLSILHTIFCALTEL